MAKKSFTNAIASNTKLGEKSGVSAVFSSTAAPEPQQPSSAAPASPASQKTAAPKTTEKKTASAPVATAPPSPVPSHAPADEPKNIAHSFYITDVYLDQLKDFVYHKKTTVDPYYSQKEALLEALDLLFATAVSVPGRPASIRKKEAKRSKNIIAGKKK